MPLTTYIDNSMVKSAEAYHLTRDEPAVAFVLSF